MVKIFVFTLILFITSNRNMDNLVTIESSLHLPNVSSGSGMAIVEDKIFIVGDDSPYLYELNREFMLSNKHLLVEDLPTEGRIPKAVKPDFECMAEEKTDHGTSLWMFGSGSKSPERDLLVIYDPGAPESLAQYTLTDFYERIIALGNIQREQLNLEAAVILDHNLYLFNRGHNQIVIIRLAQFKSYLNSNGSSSALSKMEIEIREMELSLAGNTQSRFSGACHLPGTSMILFSATLEDTDNWIDDGEILGSMLGTIDTQHPDTSLRQTMAFINDPGGAKALEKIESISFKGYDGQGNLRLLAVADNDDGSSKLFTLRVDKKFMEKTP